MNRLVSFLAAAVISLVPSSNAFPAADNAPEQAVIVHFDYGHTDWAPFFRFETQLEERIKASGVGDFDGNELASDGSEGILYMYGPDADKLFAVVKPMLQSSALLKNVVVTLRYGSVADKNAREVKVRLGS